jgi:hypothetical protein
MTQKELLYIEDAIGHESNIIAICEDIISKLKDESLINFLESEVKKHKSMKKKLMNMLEVKCDE